MTLYAGVTNNPTVTLPSEYTQLESIMGGMGGQWIGTGVIASDNSKVEMGLIYKGHSAVDNIVFGASYGYGDFSVAFYGGKLRFHARGSWVDIDVDTLNEGVNHIVLTQSGFTLNGVSYTFTGTKAVRKAEICIFYATDIAGLANCGLNPISYFKLYDGDTLLRDMVPAKKNSSGLIGMYDILNNKFYLEYGADPFIAGMSLDGSSVARIISKMYVGVPIQAANLPSGYTQLKYIESTGTQHIDTGFKPNQDTRVVCEFQMTDPSYGDWQTVFAQRNGDASSNQFTMMLRSNTSWHSAYASQALYPTFGKSNQTDKVVVDANKNSWSVTGADAIVYNSATFQSAYSLYLFACNTGGSTGHTSKMKLYSCKIYDNGTLVRNFIPAKNSGGTIGMYDTVNGGFYTNAGSGTFVAGTAFDGTSVARKVKKAYIGVNAIARKFFGGELKAKDTSITLSTSRADHASATVGDYALFAGGAYNIATVDAYNKDLTRFSPSNLSAGRQNLASATVGDYALFVSGINRNSQALRREVDTYDRSLTKGALANLTVTGRFYAASASVGNYALFVGGSTSSSGDGSYDAFAYDSSLTYKSLSSLDNRKTELMSTSVGNYALFAGGNDGETSGDDYKSVFAYNKSLTRSTVTSLANYRAQGAGATVGGHALFAGGYVTRISISSLVDIDVYNSSLTKMPMLQLSVGRADLSAVTLDGYVLFAGGIYRQNQSSGTCLTSIDVFDESLTRTTISDMKYARAYFASATVGDYALFAGGRTNLNGDTFGKNTIDVYEIV